MFFHLWKTHNPANWLYGRDPALYPSIVQTIEYKFAKESPEGLRFRICYGDGGSAVGDSSVCLALGAIAGFNFIVWLVVNFLSTFLPRQSANRAKEVGFA